ncbi:MAG: Wzz/FepE/Etk N-terminal domain-containing protein [Flavisolibacter sp.]
MDFIYLMRVLLKRKWIIIASAILAAALAYYLTKDESKKYRSSTQISTGYAIRQEIAVNDKDFDPYAADTKFNNATVTFTSPSVLSLLSYELILHDLSGPSPFRRLNEKQKQSDIYRHVNIAEAKNVFQNRLDSMAMLTSYKPEERKLLEFLKLYGYDYRSLEKNLAIFRVQRTDYLQIDYLSENPELSAFVVNNLYQQFIRYYRGVNEVRSTESIDTLKSIMDKKKQELDIKNALLSKFSGADADMGASTMDAAGQLQAQLSTEKALRNQKDFELQRVKQKIANYTNASTSQTQPDGSSNSELLAAQTAANEAYSDWQSDESNKTKKEKYEKLNNNYLSLLRKSSSVNTGNNFKPSQSLSDLEDRKAELESEIQGHNSTISDLQKNISMLEGNAKDMAAQGQTLETVKRDRDQANQEYLEAKRHYNDAIDINGSSVNNFRQTVYGQPAIEPEPSKRKMIVAMAGAAAFVTTILIIIFLTYLDSSIKTPFIFSKTVNLKLISMVNFMDLRNKKLEDIVANRNNNAPITDRNKFNAFRESIRKLRYEIENTGKKIFLFTSTKKGQGKTTLIQALSYSMSLSKKKILIIDTNFCNPDLTVQLNADPVLEKIVPYKANGTALVDQVKNFSKDIGVGTVYAIGAEGGDYTPSEILPRENILHHLHTLTDEFDFIFLEGPPLNDFSDSKELAQYVDGVIAVFSASHIIKQIDKQSIAFFKELNGKFCGSILNMVDLKNVNAT